MTPDRKTSCTIRFEPSGLRTVVPQGTTLLEAARLAGVYVTSICGGDGYCGKCKIVVDEGETEAPPTTLLSKQEHHDRVVLACETRVRSDVTVTIPKSHQLDTGRILLDSDAHRFSELAAEGIVPSL